MGKLTRQYIDDHMVGIHTEESWARAVTEMVLKAASTKIGGDQSDEIEIDAKFFVTPVDSEVSGKDGISARRLCLRVCVVVSPTGHEICFHKEAVE